MRSNAQHTAPLYPEIRVRTESTNPFAWIAAVRLALRQADVSRSEIERFTEEAFGIGDPERRRRHCRSWVELEVGSSTDGRAIMRAPKRTSGMRAVFPACGSGRSRG